MRNLFRAPRRRKWFSLRDRPYVLWTLKDGSQILADRGYNPIAERAWERGIGHVIDRWRWVEDIAEERWIETPKFTIDDKAACRRWSDKILWLFLDGCDMRPVLQAYPIQRYLPTGERLYTDRSGIERLPAWDCRRSAPSDEDWPGPWPEGLRRVDPATVPLSPIERIERRLERERRRYALRHPELMPPEPTVH